MDKVKDYITNPLIWILAAGFYLLIYTLCHRVKRHDAMPFLDLKNIFYNHRHIFLLPRDYLFFVILPFFLAMATQMHKALNADISNLICVILSILESTVLTFMAMANDKTQHIEHSCNITLQELHEKAQLKDTIAVGMYEVIMGIIVLVLTFIYPIIENYRLLSRVVSFLVYWGFFIFVLNIMIMARRLYQIYFPHDSNRD